MPKKVKNTQKSLTLKANKSAHDKFIDVVISVFLGILALISIFPFYNVILVSLANPISIAKQGVYLIPTSFDFSSYGYIFSQKKFGSSMLISLFVTLLGTFVNILCTFTGGYVLSKKFVPGTRFIKNAIIFTMLFSGGLIPYYLTLKNMGFINNLLVMIFPAAMSTFYLIIVINYFLTFPASLEESAKIDGANDIYILFRIVLPASLPTLACITLFYSVDRWNEWWLAMLFISDLNKYPLQLLLRDMLTNYAKLEGQLGISHVKVYDQGLKMAVVAFTALPILCVYPFLQKYFASGIMIGSVKG